MVTYTLRLVQRPSPFSANLLAPDRLGGQTHRLNRYYYIMTSSISLCIANGPELA
jgi:hypothetical protein